jgi:hypothetical protein
MLPSLVRLNRTSSVGTRASGAQECPLCLEALFLPCRSGPCGHAFHPACFEKFLAGGICPLCRGPLNPYVQLEVIDHSYEETESITYFLQFNQANEFPMLVFADEEEVPTFAFLDTVRGFHPPEPVVWIAAELNEIQQPLDVPTGWRNVAWDGSVASENLTAELLQLLYKIDTVSRSGMFGDGGDEDDPVPTADTILINGVPVLQQVPGHPNAQVFGPIVVHYINQTSGA